MKKVFLHGELGESLGKEWDLEVDSVQEVFCAIEANTNRFTRFLAENSEKFKYYTFQIDDEYLTSKKELESKLPKKAKNIHIMPQMAGGAQILVQIVIAVATSLIMQALFKPPKAKEQKETRSYLFAGTQNVAAQGIPVPLGYGRLKVGSVVVSATVRHLAYAKGVQYSRAGGMGLPFENLFNPTMIGIIRESSGGYQYRNITGPLLEGPETVHFQNEIIGNDPTVGLDFGVSVGGDGGVEIVVVDVGDGGDDGGGQGK
tara:strand:- start:670 stop:1446 length:777 start_codon:yes stop_codon:yes gene_type:complete